MRPLLPDWLTGLPDWLTGMQGGGEVRLAVPVVKSLLPVALTEEGMVKRVRGIAHSMRVSPQSSNRMVRHCSLGPRLAWMHAVAHEVACESTARSCSKLT